MAASVKKTKKQPIEEPELLDDEDDFEEGEGTEETEDEPTAELKESEYYVQAHCSIIRGNSFKVYNRNDVLDISEITRDSEKEVVKSMIKNGLLAKSQNKGN